MSEPAYISVTIWETTLLIDEKKQLPGYFCSLFIGPEFDHWLPLSLTNSCLVDLIDLTLACEDANSKLFEVVTVADVHAERRVDDRF